ncbi:MAG: ankyrin repeat domain-containing protein [Parachlamydiaceae bacterium]|nr:MAG: ankyrin repeat domain-containing protein [Parachlamydiaceae bacterium]
MTIDNQGRTLLDKAAEEGNLNAVKYAVEILKWDVNKPNRNDLTPLYYAAKKEIRKL